MNPIANISIVLDCTIKSRLPQDKYTLASKEVASIKLQVEMAINSMPGITTKQPDTLTGIRVHIKKEE